MAQSALGAALTIPQSALDAIDKADRKLKDIQSTATSLSGSVSTAFGNMATGTKPFLDALDQIISKLGTINASASNAGSGLGSIGQGMGSMGSNASKAAQDLSNLVNQLSSIGGNGSSSIMQAVYAFKRLQEATKGASGMNIAQLKEEIRSINSILSDKSYNLTSADQDSLNKRKKLLQDELKYQQQVNEERVISFQKALDRMVSAQQSYNNKQRRQYSDRAKDYQASNYAQNTTYQGALDFSNSANTLNRNAKAIEYLKAAKMSLSTADADYKQKLATLNAAIDRHTQKLKEASAQTREMKEQTSYMAGYLSRWAQRMAFAFSIDTLKNFVEQMATVRGQFELSERSLEAILQNKPKADEIFNKTVELAVKSPFRIKDLVDYTRQLSAYRIESDKLYDTTKRLADVSAGLGVDMGRLILAYGQVKAAAYLRGSEVRQFTEAGINMYGELQQYFKEVKGEAYTTAQIVDMISKRQVTFEDVEAVFQRMTDKGGTFYNMQEIQAETLQGKISNLHDAFDVMLNDIGKSNESSFKGLIDSATEMLENWRTITNVAKVFLGLILSIYATSRLTSGAWGQTAANIMASHQKLGVFKALLSALSGGTGRLSSAFAALGSTVMASLPLAALTAAIALVQELISVSREYNEAMSQNTKEYYTAQVRVDEIDAESKTDIQKALQDLVKEMNQKGFEIKINVNLSEEEAKKQYSELLSDYQEFLNEILVIDARYAANKKKGWLIGDDDIETDMKEYSSSLGEFLSKGEEIRYILAQVSKESTNLTDSQRKMFEQLAAGPQKGQNLIDYYSKVGNQLKELGYIRENLFGNTEVRGGFLGGMNWGIGAENDNKLSDFANSYATYLKNLEEVRKEARSVFGDVSKYQDEASKKRLKILIDNEAIKRGWGDIEKDMLYKEYKINVGIDKGTAKKEVSWLDDYIKGFFAKRKYGISLDVKEISNDKALEDFISKGDQAAKAAKNWQELTKRLATVARNAKEIKIDDSIRKLFKPGTIPMAQKTISVSYLRALVAQYKKAATDTAKNAYGVDPFEKENRKSRNKAEKQQRDLLQDRISLLKDMNSKYDDLIKTESKEAALSKTRKYFKEAAQNVGWNANDIMPDDASVAKRIKEIGAKYKDLAKRGNAFRMSADIDLRVSEKEYNKLKDDISQNIDEAFSGLDLYKKLKETGLTDENIKDMFGNLTTSFSDIRGKIDDEFNKYIFKAYQTRYGDDFNKWSEATIKKYNADIANTGQTIKTMFDPQSDVAKDYLSQTRKLDKQVYQDQVSQAQELIKAYKTQLSDQLQLDAWYLGERKKLQEKVKDPELQKELQGNLDAQYKKKTDENKWKEFQNSDMYVRLFDNLDQVSTKALDAMAEKLQEMRDNLKNLDPTELKTITEQLNKVNNVRASRNPFKAMSSSIKEMAAASKQLKSLGGVDEYARLNNQRSDINGELETRNKEVKLLEQEYDKIKDTEGAESELAEKAKFRLSIAKGMRDSLKTQLGLTDQQIEKLGAVMTAEEQAKSKFEKSIDDVSSIVSSLHSAFSSLMSTFGSSSQEIEGAFSALSGALTAVKSYKSGDAAGFISGVTGVISGIASIFNNESGIDKEIERQEMAVTRLEAAYNKLKTAMDNAFDTSSLYEYNQKSIDALEKEQQAYEAMIKAEEGRKNPDESKILSYQQKIDDLGDTIKELGENMTEALGGFGSESNYKSAAEAFAEAWVDAYNEGSDALDALNDKFNEYIQNLITKQATQRVVGKLIEPLLKEIDKAVSEGSEGGNNGLDLTESELAKIKELGKTATTNIDEALSSLMGVLDYKPKGSSNISALQQGIQSVTESTAQALESVLNSMRYYLATQQADVRMIRDTLVERLAISSANVTQDGSSSPMLVELRLQTSVLTDIRDMLSSCVKSGHRQGRNGIKVFMD